MPIVDFEQDPDMPVGTGNFRDEKGRVMYLSDPDTASNFIKTIPGRSLKSTVGAESTAIAQGAMGASAPAAGPDMRLANNASDTGLPTPVGDLSLPAPPMPNTAPPTAADVPSSALTPQETVALGGKPAPAPAAPAASPRAVALVGKLNQLPKKPTPSAATAPTAPAAPSGGGLPLAGITTTSGRSVVKGANLGNVKKRIGEEDAAMEGVLSEGTKLAESKDARTAAAFDTQISSTTGQIGAEGAEITAQQRKKERFERFEGLKREELKKNDESFDPERYMKNKSAGQKLGMIILAALNGGFGALNGQKDNGVLAVIDQEIERDIDDQKQQIASGRVRIGNEVDKYMKQGFDAETAEKLARDRQRSAVAQLAELNAKKTGATGENAANMAYIASQTRAEQAKRRGDLLATTEDRAQTSEQETVQRAVPKATGGTGEMLKRIELELKSSELRNKKIANANAEDLSREIYGVDKAGNPKQILTPDEAKELKDKVATVGPAIAELAGAVTMTDELIASLGGKMDATTGKIEWPKDGDLKGTGPVDSHGGYTGALTKVPRMAGLYRADVDKAREKQGALKEYVTSQMTGANSTLRQDATYGTMVGGDFSNEDQTRENVEAWARTLFSERNKHMARLGKGGMALMRRNEAAADRGADTDTLRPGIN